MIDKMKDFLLRLPKLYSWMLLWGMAALMIIGAGTVSKALVDYLLR
jgi:hypothetical protein